MELIYLLTLLSDLSTFFSLFWWNLHTQKLQSLKYTEFRLIRIPKTIPTCFTTQTFLAFDVYKRESSNINLSFHKQLKEALGWEQNRVSAFENTSLLKGRGQREPFWFPHYICVTNLFYIWKILKYFFS